MVGCKHNLERTIEYRFTGKPKPQWDDVLKLRFREPSATIGDEVVFKCPHGCEEISVLLGDHPDDRPKVANNGH